MRKQKPRTVALTSTEMVSAPGMLRWAMNGYRFQREVVTGDGVRGADDEAIELVSGRRIETRTIVWSAGIKPRVLAGTEALPRAKNGAILVAADMSVPDAPGIWACGDCAAIPDGAGKFYPPTAQHAIREAPLLAENLAWLK